MTVPIPSPVKFATGLVYGNPLYDEILVRGGDPATIRATVSAAIERELGSEMPLQALIVRASLS